MGHTPPAGAGGRFQRQEAEAEISAAEARTLSRGGEITAAPFLLLREVAPGVGPLRVVARVRNRRQVAILEDAGPGQAELALDRVTYEVGEVRRGPEIEVEIENHGRRRPELRALARSLEKELGMVPSQGSKYERALG
jgi:inorganic triphosphatase YgiF